MKKTFTTLLCIFITIIFTSAQNADSGEVFQRKGRFIVESGLNLIGGLNSGTGVSIFSNRNESVTTASIEAGKFLSNNFALKLRSSLTIVEDLNVFSISIGSKYYIGGNIPIELSPGFFFEDGESFFVNLNIGYAAKLAQNIYLEPAITMSLNESNIEDGLNYGFKSSFVMIL